MASLTIKKYVPSYGSHMPLLVKAMEASQGPVLELGIGPFSTPLLHALCEVSQRPLVSYDNDNAYIDAHRNFVSDNHQIIHVDDWDKADIENTKWGLVLVDHGPAERRISEIRRLTDKADYILIHDSNGRHDKIYHYSEVYPLFKYRYEYGKIYPHTTVLSNFYDLENLKS